MDDPAAFEIAARRLGIDKDLLRESVAGRSRSATMRVIESVIRVYGLDPTWVLMGKYDPATHRAAVQAKEDEVKALVRRLVSESARDTDSRAE